MSGVLTPECSAVNDLFVSEGNEHHVVWFVDYTSTTAKHMRDVVLRSVDRFELFDLAFAVRFFPASDRGEPAELAARAAISAANQGRFPDMHRALFDASPAFSQASIKSLAEDLGLDTTQFAADLYSDETSARLERDFTSATQSAPIPQTPMMFIDGQLYEGAWDEVSFVEALERPLGVRLNLASEAFLHWAASAGSVLVLATVAALLVVNLGWSIPYDNLRETLVGLSFGAWHFELPVEVWINDGLMALFFLIVGIEIKRELIDGELSDPASAALPLIGALGGMLVPAGIFVLVNWGEPSVNGWGVPMATDIAFTLGILALLGNRVPTSLKVFVSALAIADDLGAILVIAIFYGHGFQMHAFVIAGIILLAMVALNIGRVYRRTPYLILGTVLWYFIHESGLHATLAGVLTAIAIPSRPSAEIKGIALQANKIFEYELRNPEQPAGHTSILRLQAIIDRLRDPGFHLQHGLENWSQFLILPLFAFFNTGILILGASFAIGQPAVLGTLLGLLVGKPLGIFLFVYVAVKLGWARLSSEISWSQIFGAGLLCGIGFTMSIFIASAAFDSSQLQSVKLAILLASAIAGVLGTIVLVMASRKKNH